MSKLVLCTLRFTDDLLDRLRAVSPALEVVQHTAHNLDEFREYPKLKEVEILYYGWLKPPAPADIPSVRWIQLHTAGANQLLGAPILQSDIAITTASGVHSTPITEYTFAQILAWQRRIPLMLHYQQRGEWPTARWDQFAVPELRGATLGVVGYGRIGKDVARLGVAFGMNVLAVRRSHSPDPAYPRWTSAPDWDDGVVQVLDSAGLYGLLARSDYVVIALPLTDETRHIIDADALRAMKPSAYLINIARGPVIDEQALVRALQEGWIAGAGLDVFEKEPLPADSPLWEMDNVILSPHVSGFTPLYDTRATDLFAENLRRYLAGERLLNLFDPNRGY
ncbi:MAG: D-2-hydroxyacid dehydrogenase [Anaerolineae bacterium]